jgi:hypothetical protein
MTYSKKAESQLMSIFVPMIVICILAVSFGLIVTDLGTNYSVSSNDTSYERIEAASANITAISGDTSDSVIGDNGERSNVLTSTERLVTGAYNAILVLGNVPGIYITMIDVVALNIGIDATIVNLVMAGILFSIVAVVIYLALGRI